MNKEGATRHSRSALFVRASIASVCASGIFAVLLFARQSWTGSGELPLLLAYSCGLAVVVGVVCALTVPVLGSRSPWIRHVASALLGLGTGFVFTSATLLMMGPVFDAWSVPVLQCWLAGGVAGAMVSTAGLERSRRKRFGALGVMLALLVSLWLGYAPLILAMRRDQHLTLTFARLIPSAVPGVIDDPRDLATVEEERLFQKAHVLGGIRVERGFSANTVDAPIARVLVVAKEPIRDRVRLAQPDGTTIIYVQTNDGFRMYPPNAPTLQRGIELRPSDGNPNTTLLRAEMAGGFGRSSGGIAFVWE